MGNGGMGEQKCRDLINSPAMLKQISLALPKHLTADRFLRVVTTAVPKIQGCTESSIIKAMMDCSSLGLEPDGWKAHLVPFKDTDKNIVECQLIIDYRGLTDLARRNGEVTEITCDYVCENDTFEYSIGTDGRLNHAPPWENRGKILGFYSFVRLKDGTPSYRRYTLAEIAAVRERSKAKNKGPWKDFPNTSDSLEMGKKSAFRNHSKWLPMSSEFYRALEIDADRDPSIGALITGKPLTEAPRALTGDAGKDPEPGAEGAAGDGGEPGPDMSTGPQQQKIHILDGKIHGKDKDKLYVILESEYHGVKSTKELTKEEASGLIKKFMEQEKALG